MYEQTNTMMETKTSFQIPQLLDGDDFTSEDLADDMEGLRLSFTRIKIPGGGHLQFEIPSGNPDVPDYAPYLEGVILYSHNSNAYWPEGSEYDDDQPPLCQSFDGKVGYCGNRLSSRCPTLFYRKESAQIPLLHDCVALHEQQPEYLPASGAAAAKP